MYHESLETTPNPSLAPMSGVTVRGIETSVEDMEENEAFHGDTPTLTLILTLILTLTLTLTLI